MRIALLIAAKDLRQRLRDRSIIVLSVVAPLGLAVVFAGLLGGASDFHATYLVVDEDGGSVAVAFRDQALGGLADADVATVETATSESAALESVEAGDADAVFVIPAGFSDAVTSGRATTIAVHGGTAAGLATEVARSVVERFGEGVAGIQLAVATTTEVLGHPLTPEEIGAVVAAATTAPQPIEVADVAATLRQLSWPTYFSASMAIMFLFLAAQVAITSLFEERRTGTLARILAGPISPSSVLFGKAIAGFVTGAVAMAILVGATTALLGADWGPPLGVGLIVGGGVVASIGIATFVASFARSAEAAGAAASAVAITLAIFGGTFTPASQGPEIMATFSLLTPHAWFLRGLGDLHGTGATVADALPAVAVLLVIGLVTGGLGFARARRLVSAR